MKKISAILVMALVLAMTVIPVSAADIDVALTTESTTVEVGDTITVDVIYSPADTLMTGAEFTVNFDSSLVEITGNPTVTAGSVVPNKKTDSIFLACASSIGAEYVDGKIATITFTAIANGSATFSLAMDYMADNSFNEYDEFNTAAPITVTIGSEPDPEPEVFAISATESGNDVVVTVENADLAVGEEIKVYVATYTDGDVLVTCQEQALVEGTMTFTGLANANAKVFVWDNQNVPVANVTIQ